MVIYFSLFDIEKSDRCQNDNFTVQIEKNQQDIRRYCESLHKIEIRKTRVQLKFHSNDAIAREGMKAHVCLTSDNKRTDDELPCNCRFNGGRSKRDQSTGRIFFPPSFFLFVFYNRFTIQFMIICIVIVYCRIKPVSITRDKVLQKNKTRKGEFLRDCEELAPDKGTRDF